MENPEQFTKNHENPTKSWETWASCQEIWEIHAYPANSQEIRLSCKTHLSTTQRIPWISCKFQEDVAITLFSKDALLWACQPRTRCSGANSVLCVAFWGLPTRVKRWWSVTVVRNSVIIPGPCIFATCVKWSLMSTLSTSVAFVQNISPWKSSSWELRFGQHAVQLGTSIFVPVPAGDIFSFFSAPLVQMIFPEK